MHGSACAFSDLDIAEREPGIPLYVGKAQKSLASRDVRVHFSIGTPSGSTTGQSTLRRSLAALLVDHLQLRPVPREKAPPHRFAMFALDEPSDARLTEWMHEHLRLATWVMPAEAGVSLGAVESAVITRLVSPLNLSGSPNPQFDLKAARARMARRARESVQAGRMES
ncbi:MAG: hypothetical protein RIC81_00840 [Microcella pacifica]